MHAEKIVLIALLFGKYLNKNPNTYRQFLKYLQHIEKSYK